MSIPVHAPEVQMNPAKEVEAYEVGQRKQLFIDEKFVAENDGVVFEVHPPADQGPVLTAEEGWESHRLGAYGTIVKHGDVYRMYYHALPPIEDVDHCNCMICLAESDDGVHWHRRNVNLYEVMGTKENNVVMPGCVGTVFVDPKETDGCRYWWVGTMGQTCIDYWTQNSDTVHEEYTNDAGQFVRRSGLYLMKSADGIHWKRDDRIFLPFWCDSQNQCLYDERLGRYVAYVRGRRPAENPHPLKDRTVCRIEGDSLVETPWPFNQDKERPLDNDGLYAPWGGVLDELPIVMDSDEQDPPQTDIYNPCVNAYPYAEDVYVAFPTVYRHFDGFDACGRDPRGKRPNDGRAEVQLAVSRDGINFKRYRTAYVPPRLGTQYAGQSYMMVSMIRQGDQLYQYGGGTACTHGGVSALTDRLYHGAITRFTQRLDGFVSLSADSSMGSFTTPPVIFEGNRLEVNVDCGAMGEIWIEVLTPEGKPYEGFAKSDSVSIDGNDVAAEVWWRNGPDLSRLSGSPVRLRFHMRSARIYAFQFRVR